MYSNSYVESDGDLYKMQQEAIRRAREMSKAATLPPPPPPPKPPTFSLLSEPEKAAAPEAPAANEYSVSQETAAEPLSRSKKGGLFGGKGLFGGGKGLFGGLLSNLKLDDILLLILLFLLLTERADDDIILIVAFLLIVGFLDD